MKFGSTRPRTVNGTIRDKNEFAPCRLYSCSWWRKPPTSNATPIIPLSTIITIPYMVSRANVGLFSPVSMTAEIIITSMPMTESVSTSVPRGSPSLTARLSAWCTTAKAELMMTAKSQTSMKTNHSGFERSESQPLPKSRNKAVVAKATARSHSCRRLEKILGLPAIASVLMPVVVSENGRYGYGW